MMLSKKLMKRPGISIIGAGNVGTQLANAFCDAGYPIVQICSRSEERTRALAEAVNAAFVTDPLDLSDEAELYIFCISEEDLYRLPEIKQLKNKLLCHTSGSTPMEILEPLSADYGILYPLQTFSLAHQVNLSNVPVLIEANTEANLSVIEDLARGVSEKVQVMKGPDRMALHLAAVIACNFTNHLYARAEELLNQHNLPFELLHPLILETARKAAEMSPVLAQTGPALRGDKKILAKHKELLFNDPAMLDIYEKLSDAIISLKTRKP
jgi:predicted short-subunit dehydrogenase-like oxidoreductase (DUF2520 family)